jgi:hypothetical protein
VASQRRLPEYKHPPLWRIQISLTNLNLLSSSWTSGLKLVGCNLSFFVEKAEETSHYVTLIHTALGCYCCEVIRYCQREHYELNEVELCRLKYLLSKISAVQ